MSGRICRGGLLILLRSCYIRGTADDTEEKGLLRARWEGRGGVRGAAQSYGKAVADVLRIIVSETEAGHLWSEPRLHLQQTVPLPDLPIMRNDVSD